MVKKMLVAPAIGALLFLPSATVAPAEDADKLPDALFFEWVVANCDIKHVDPIAFAAINMIINGSSPDDVQRLRSQLQTDIRARFPEPKTACTEVRAIKPELF